ncbi:MAG: hypothetical protein WAK93_02075 [Solirubrobacteraceae bacterium]
MPKPSLPSILRRRPLIAALSAIVAVVSLSALPSAASASHSQLSMIQDYSALNPDPSAADQTLVQFRTLGANAIRVIVPWATIAPDPSKTKKPSFNATDPNAYSASAWAPFDNLVREAHTLGLKVDLTVTGGAPRWAESGNPARPVAENILDLAWKPKAADYGQFMRAVGTRYDGHFTPKGSSSALPAVRFWAIFNEPNFGEDLGPQALGGSKVAYAPMLYRSLVNSGWSALKATGHGHDTILIGETAARGLQGGRYPGNYSQTKPLIFIRDLYCLSSSYKQLRGKAAKGIGCPTNAAGSRRFRSQNPGLFNASGFGDHPYPGNGSPVTDGKSDPNYAAFPDLGRLEQSLDHVNRVYGSRKHYSIYNDEYGYITDPPNKTRVPTGGHYVSPALASYYINWAEYLSWKSSRIASYMQYLIKDPPLGAGTFAGFTSGIETSTGQEKADYAAYRLPLYMPKLSFSHTTNAEVWGDVRPAPFMQSDGHGPQSVAIQFNGTTVQTVKPGAGGYFDVHMKFAQSGTVRLAYTYPASDPFLTPGVAGTTVYSRDVAIKVH